MNETLRQFNPWMPISRHAFASRERMPRDLHSAGLVVPDAEKRPPLRHAANVEGPFATPAIVESSGVNV